MKARMKKLISIKSIPILALALLIVFGTALAAGLEPVSGSGEVSLIAGEGPVNLTIGGEEWVGTIRVIMGPVAVRPGGVTQYLDIVHIFSDEAENTFTTIGGEITAPTGEEGVYTLSGDMEITGGKGSFEGACGSLRVNGELNYKTEKILFDVYGAMAL